MFQNSVASDTPFKPSERPLTYTLFFIIALFAFSIFVRIITAEYVDIGGDNTTRWVDALRLAKGMGFADWSHHNMRWSIMLPLWGLLKLFGTQPALYYVLPILASSIGAVFIYLIGRQLHSEKLGICAAVLTILFPQMAQSGSQLWPSVFQFTFAAISCWAILQWHANKATSLLFCAALFYFLAWGARTSTVYYFPGLLFLVWYPGKNYRAAFLFGLFVALLVAGEWLFFYFDSGNPMGRIGLIKRAAVNSVATVPLKDYLLNPLNLTKLRGLLPIFILTVVASISLLKSRDERIRALSAFHLIFLFFFLYMVSGFSPIRLAQPTGSRYWCAIAPFGLTLLLIWLFEIKRTRPRVSITLISILFIAFALFSIKKIPARNAFVQTAADAATLTSVMEAKQPILLHWAPWTPNWIESQLFAILDIKKKKRKPGDLKTPMRRGSHRAVGMFSPNPDDFYLHHKGALLPVGDLSYIFVPYGTDQDASIGATVYFDRKMAYSVKGEDWPKTHKE